MKRFLSIALMTAAIFGSHRSTSWAEESPKASSVQTNLRVQTQQNTTQNGEETQNSFQVTVQGSGEVSKLEGLRTTLQSRLAKSGLPIEAQQQAIDGILLKLEEVASENRSWSGRLTWTSKSPEEANVTFEATENSLPAIEKQEPQGSTWKRPGQSADRLNDTMNRMTDRARQFQQNRSGQSNFRIGINCQELPRSSSPANGDSVESKQTAFDVQSVLKDSPAEQIGIRPGDQVELINGVPMESVEQLVEAVQSAGRDNQKLVLEVRRGSQHVEFEIQPVVMAELSFNDMRQAIPLPQFGANGQPIPGQNNLPGTPQEMFQRNFPGSFPGGFPGWNNGQSQYGPGWVMNREELNELRRGQRDQSQFSKADPEVMEQLSNLKREIAELKEMVKAMKVKE